MKGELDVEKLLLEEAQSLLPDEAFKDNLKALIFDNKKIRVLQGKNRKEGCNRKSGNRRQKTKQNRNHGNRNGGKRKNQ